MKKVLVLNIFLFVFLSVAFASDYTITVLKPDSQVRYPHLENQGSASLIGKSIAEIFGPISEVRVDFGGGNRTGIEEDSKKIEKRIRERIDRAKCLGRDSEVFWHRAPWARGYILFKDGRIFPLELMLSGIIVGDLFFSSR